jgi:dihydrodipicolinate synthase/N-acetylneuraminate lyase
MKEIREIVGVVPVVQTALTAERRIDIGSQINLIKFLLQKDIGGFWCLGTGSEDMNMTFDKRLIAAQTICDANAAERPIILGCGFYCLEDSLNFIDATANLNFDAYHYMPYHPLLSMEQIAWIYDRIASYSPKPLFMYTSANWAQYIKPDFVDAVASHKNICGVKYSSSNTVDQLKVLAMQQPDFQVVTAVANQFYAALAMGSKAGTTSMAGALPEPLIELYDTFVHGDIVKARDLQINFQSFTSQLPKKVKADNFLGAAEEKYILKLRGICEEFTTEYYRALNDSEKKMVTDALKISGYQRHFQGAR